jgi:hypothetical protein
MQYVPPKRWYTSTSPPGVTTQKTIGIFTAVITSNLITSAFTEPPSTFYFILASFPDFKKRWS